MNNILLYIYIYMQYSSRCSKPRLLYMYFFLFFLFFLCGSPFLCTRAMPAMVPYNNIAFFSPQSRYYYYCSPSPIVLSINPPLVVCNPWRPPPPPSKNTRTRWCGMTSSLPFSFALESGGAF